MYALLYCTWCHLPCSIASPMLSPVSSYKFHFPHYEKLGLFELTTPANDMRLALVANVCLNSGILLNFPRSLTLYYG